MKKKSIAVLKEFECIVRCVFFKKKKKARDRAKYVNSTQQCWATIFWVSTKTMELHQEQKIRQPACSTTEPWTIQNLQKKDSHFEVFCYEFCWE